MIYIQTPNGLTQVSPSLTKEKIIAALGYTPADNISFFEDESGHLIIADEKGYILARFTENGFETTTVSAKAIQLDGKDLEAKLQELIDAIPEVDLSGYATQKYVDDAVGVIEIPEVDTTGLATEEALNAHMDDPTAHFSGNYSDLQGAPNASNDNEEELIICDASGNVIMRVNANGLNVAAVYINGKPISGNETKFYIRWDTDEAPTAYSFIPGMNFKDWANSEYCASMVAYNTVEKYYRHTSAELAILEDYNDNSTVVTHNTSIFGGKIFYAKADGGGFSGK